MFLLLSLSSSTIPDSLAPEGYRAGLRFRRFDTYDKPTGKTLDDKIVQYINYKNENFNDYELYEGSFCAPSSGNWKAKLHFRCIADLKGDVPNLNKVGRKSLCTSAGVWDTQTTESKWMYEGQCYPIIYGKCLGTLSNSGQETLEFSKEDDVWIYNGNYVTSFDKQRCLKGYYGNPCKKCTAYCNGNGYCGGLATSDNAKDRCKCTSHKDDPFCTDFSIIPSTGKERGIKLTITDKTNAVLNTTIYTSPLITDIEGAYDSIDMNFYVYCPQKSMYQIRCVSDISTILSVNNYSAGSISTFSCENSEVNKSSESMEFSANQNIVNVRVKAECGCTLFKHQFRIQWKFYRYYQDQDQTPQWSDIPEIYLFH